jgi:signal transduction histidine kinase
MKTLSVVDEATKNKVDALNGKAWEVRVNDSNQALLLSKEALSLAEGIGYKKGKAESLRTLGFCHIRHAEHDKAAERLDKALLLFLELEDLKGQSDIYEYRGIISRCEGDYATSLEYLYKSKDIRKELSYDEGITLSYYHLGITYKYLGNYSKALDFLMRSLEVSRKCNSWVGQSYALNNIGLIYFETEDHAIALDYFQQSLAIRQANGDKWGEAGCLDNIGSTYVKLGDYTEALRYCQQSLEITMVTGDKKGQGNSLFHLGNIYFQLKDYEQAQLNWLESQKIRREIRDRKGQADILYCLSELYTDKDFTESNVGEALLFLEQGLHIGEEIKAKDTLSKIHRGYYQLLKQEGNDKEALFHFERHIALEKEVHSEEISKKVLNLEISHRVEQAKKETEIFRLRNIELAELNKEIQEQKDRTELQRDVLRKTLTNLKATQTQLVQSEKMASLGELTAGIAHEIQNPLNFVNNFSEVSVELCSEIGEEMEKGQLEEAKSSLEDLVQNLLKIQQHGRRAEAIVKGMLQHSRSSTGQKELTDLNALANEYMRLAYHGLRAKDQSFNTALTTEFDEKLRKVSVVPQELGRVLLNLFNNAFYSVQQKQKQGLKDYKPEVRLTTLQRADTVEVRVRDNGTGIPEKVREKIFQPFFTTKPSGQGTGLGLSLSYDIITKGHGGNLTFDTAEGQYTEFTIQLPVPADPPSQTAAA